MAKRPTNKQYRAAAKLAHHVDGEIEIDDKAKISKDPKNEDQGAYVQAWIWVSDEEIGNV